VTDVLIGLLVAFAYLTPSVLFALAIKPAGEAVQAWGRSASTI
jgi:hypothetical protein